ncbi:MAG: class I SAM-dependent methyltransferase [Bacteroidota bacterium]|nr:class I SAM-dependent methyltransferase [Bacteroidota bacterium]
MNKNVLETKVQEFIRKNLFTDITKIILKGSPFRDVSAKELATQIEGLQKAKKKLPTWHNTSRIYFPIKLSIEQTSSEKTAKYKSELVSGKSLIDLTGGLGVDCLYFSKTINHITHCELNKELSAIAKHNFECFNSNNIECYNGDGLLHLDNSKKHYDWIYIDPARRDNNQNRVFRLKDSTPDIPSNLNNLFKHTNNILIKAAPLFDIKQGLKELRFVKEVHVVSVDNECRELLFLLEKNYNKEPKIITVNISNNPLQTFNFSFKEEQNATSKYSEPKEYLYEPNTSILKAGAFQCIGTKLDIEKLNINSHLYTSSHLVDNFPGRRFQITQTLSFDLKGLKKSLSEKRANISCRNFPLTVEQVKKKTKLRDGGDTYLFFTRTTNNKPIIIITKKSIK